MIFLIFCQGPWSERLKTSAENKSCSGFRQKKIVVTSICTLIRKWAIATLPSHPGQYPPSHQLKNWPLRNEHRAKRSKNKNPQNSYREA